MSKPFVRNQGLLAEVRRSGGQEPPGVQGHRPVSVQHYYYYQYNICVLLLLILLTLLLCSACPSRCYVSACFLLPRLSACVFSELLAAAV